MNLFLDIQIEPKILSLVTSVEDNISKAVSEALNLWLERKIPICPIIKRLCVNPKGSCNECSIITEKTET